jgi:hypothetical protein
MAAKFRDFSAKRRQHLLYELESTPPIHAILSVQRSLHRSFSHYTATLDTFHWFDLEILRHFTSFNVICKDHTHCGPIHLNTPPNEPFIS